MFGLKPDKLPIGKYFDQKYYTQSALEYLFNQLQICGPQTISLLFTKDSPGEPIRITGYKARAHAGTQQSHCVSGGMNMIKSVLFVSTF